MGFLRWLRRQRLARRGSPSDGVGTDRRIYFEGGTGETIEAAIVVRGAQFDLEGTSAEFAWLAQKYGPKDTGWKLVSHSHGKHNGRDIDTFQIELADGRPLTLFFDCTESFGKWSPPASRSVDAEAERGPEDTLP